MPDSRRRFSGLLFLATLAGLGYWVVTLVPTVLGEYAKAAAFNRYWGYIYLAVCLAIAATFLLLAGWAGWMLLANSRAKQARQLARARNPSQMTLAEQERETAGQLHEARALADDVTIPPDVRAPIRGAVEAIEQKQTGQKLEIVAFGTVSSGKSSLLNALAGRDVFRTDPRGGTTVARSEVPWPGLDKVVLVDTPGLAEVQGEQRQQLARNVAADADLVLLVVDGPLKDFESRMLEQLASMEKRVIVCLNKADWFRDADRQRLREQLAEQTQSLVRPEDIVALRAQPATRTRVRVLAQGGEVEEQVPVEPDIQQLAERMLRVVERDGRELLAANLLLRARGLAADARQQVQAVLDQRAQEIVQRNMWQAGGAAALSPLPVLDVAAALAISTKMVVELAHVYRQPVDMATAGRLVSELGKNLLAVLGATAATPAIGSLVASLLKTAPGIGTIAGGVLQGLVQALVTRWIGQVFIVYFRNEMQEPELGWAALARSKWSEVTQPAELAQLVKTGLSRLGGRS